jgi:hypothetical protein
VSGFELGRIVATPGAHEAFREAGEVEFPYLTRHLLGDWGEVDGHDQRANKQALKEGTRLLSAYTLPGGRKVWIITEADRSSTCILLPSEY